MAKVRKPSIAKAVLTKEGAHRAIAIATAIQAREPLTSADRHFLCDLLMRLANDALEHRPAHRKADNGVRDFNVAMDSILTGDPAKVVAKRWLAHGITSGEHVRKIVQTMRTDVEQIVAGSTTTPEVWLRIVAWHRDGSAGSSVTD